METIVKTTSTTSPVVNPTKVKLGLPKAPVLVVIAILIIIIIALLAWALYNYNQLLLRDASYIQNPYCIRTYCSGTPQEQLYTLPSPEDPQRTAYQTTNWCIVNAPTSSLSNALSVCSDGGSVTPELTSALTKYADFYYHDYINSCGYGWKSQNVPSNVPDSNPNSPNNPNGLNGSNDVFLVNLVGCADINGITSPSIEALRSLCGTNCA